KSLIPARQDRAPGEHERGVSTKKDHAGESNHPPARMHHERLRSELAQSVEQARADTCDDDDRQRPAGDPKQQLTSLWEQGRSRRSLRTVARRTPERMSQARATGPLRQG